MRVWPLATLIFGLATLALAATFPMVPAVKAGFPNGDFIEALGQFQRAARMSDLVAVFGDPPSAAKIAAMQAGNTRDLYVFIPTYAVFLAAAAAMLAGGFRKRQIWFALTPLIAAVIGDVVETSTQLKLGADYANAVHYLPIALWCWTKFFGLAVFALGCSVICAVSPRKRTVLAIIGLVPIIGTVAFWSGLLPHAASMSQATGLFWTALLVIAVMELVRKPEASPA